MNYVLHLADRRDREKVMAQELDSFCPNDWSVWSAIREPRGKVGTSKSLRSLLAFAKARQLPSVLVFEDDVRFCSPRSRAHWDQCVSELPPDWHILLGGSYGYAGGPATEHLKKLGWFCSLHCVLYRETVYDVVQQHQPETGSPIVGDIDCWLGQLGLNVFLCDPQVAIQHDGYSDNQGGHTRYNSLLPNLKLLE